MLKLEFIKTTVNALDTDTARTQCRELAARVLGTTLHRNGWTTRTAIEHTEQEGGHRYKVTYTFTKTVQRSRSNADAVERKQAAAITARMIAAGKGRGWYPVGASAGPATAIPAVSKPPDILTPTGPRSVTLPRNIGSHFGHIYDRDAQIRIIQSAIETANATCFERRSHCLLYGKPACGKTEILLAFERMLGQGSVKKLDATTTTKAGAVNVLLEMETIPPILIIEEIEKCNPDNLSWLLGVMDERGELLKTNARTGSIRKDAKCLVLATANDFNLLKTLHAGALASRFKHELYCARPSEAILRKILTREVEKTGGNKQWVEPALRYCVDVEQINDPRRIIAVLDGRDRLLDGSYQADLRAIHDAKLADESRE